MAANAEITARQLEIGYGETLVVSDLDIHIRKGEITTIIGPNGSGKSTVLKALTRLLKYRSGVVEVLDRDLKDYDTKELARRSASEAHGAAGLYGAGSGGLWPDAPSKVV